MLLNHYTSFQDYIPILILVLIKLESQYEPFVTFSKI